MEKFKTTYSNKKAYGYILLLFAAMLLFKFASDFGYYKILSLDTTTYTLDFNLGKYVNGLIWCVILFFPIRHRERKVSTFMLYLTFLLQIIPITTIYSMGNDDAVFYNSLCFSFLLCELIVDWWPSNYRRIKRYKISAKIILIGVIVSILLFIVYVIAKNGPPTLTALNIYDVYDLRESGRFQLNRYMWYFMEWIVLTMLPFLLALAIYKRKYAMAVAVCMVTFLIYLYSGYKSVLFSMPMVILCTIWSNRKNSYTELFSCACIGFVLLVLLGCFSPILRKFFREIYSLFGRRVMMLPANIKFKYFDFFSNNPKMGFGAIFPRWLIRFPNPYENINYSCLIADIYYGKPKMNANTGFLVEGYMRFGHLGTVGSLCLFAFLLRLMDHLQKHIGYAFTVGFFAYSVMCLTDKHLIDALIFGTWNFLVVVMFFFTEYGMKKNSKRNDYVQD